MELRDYQIEAFEALKSSFLNGDGKGLLVLATGLGKTVVAEAFLQWLFENKHITKCAVLCHLSAGTDQLVRKFSESTFVGDKPIARYESEEDLKASIVCTTYQKVFHAEDFPFESFDLVIADEAHHSPATMFSLVTESFSEAVYYLGLTATPFRLDGQQLSELFGHTIYEQDLLWGIEHGWLAEMAYWSITSHLNSKILNELEASGRKISLKEINQRLFDQADPLKVWEELQKRCPGEQAIIFCRSIAHAEAVQAAFEKEEPGCSVLISSKKSKEANQRSLNAYGSGEKQYLIGIDMPIEMLDFPNTSVIVLWRVSQSLRIFLQSLGRGLRKHEGKEQLTVLDFVGFAENVNPWTEYADFSGFEDADEVEGFGYRVQLVPGLTLWGDVSYVEMMSKVESLLSRLTVADLKDHPIGHVLFTAFDENDHHLTWGSHRVVKVRCLNESCKAESYMSSVRRFTGGQSLSKDKMGYSPCCTTHPIKERLFMTVSDLKHHPIGYTLYPAFKVEDHNLPLAASEVIEVRCLNSSCDTDCYITKVIYFTGGQQFNRLTIQYSPCCGTHPIKGEKERGRLKIVDLKGHPIGGTLFDAFKPADRKLALGTHEEVEVKCLNTECSIDYYSIKVISYTGGSKFERSRMRYSPCCGTHPIKGRRRGSLKVSDLKNHSEGQVLYPAFRREHDDLALGSLEVIEVKCLNPSCDVESYTTKVIKFIGGQQLDQRIIQYSPCCGTHPIKGSKRRSLKVVDLKDHPKGTVLYPAFQREHDGLVLGSSKEVEVKCLNDACDVQSYFVQVVHYTGGQHLNRLSMVYSPCCGTHPLKGRKLWIGRTVLDLQGHPKGKVLYPAFRREHDDLTLGSKQEIEVKCLNDECDTESYIIEVCNYTGGDNLKMSRMQYSPCCHTHPIKGEKTVGSLKISDLRGHPVGDILYAAFSRRNDDLALGSAKEIEVKCLNSECDTESYITKVYNYTGGRLFKQSRMRYSPCCGTHPIKGGRQGSPKVSDLREHTKGKLLYPAFRREHDDLTLGSKQEIEVKCLNSECDTESYITKVCNYTGGSSLRKEVMQYSPCCGAHPIKGEKEKGRLKIVDLKGDPIGGSLYKAFKPVDRKLSLGSNKEVEVRCLNGECGTESYMTKVCNYTGGPHFQMLIMRYSPCCNWHPLKGYKHGYGPPKDSKDKK